MQDGINPGLDDLVRLALAEDIGSGDRTTRLLIDPGQAGRATVVAKERLVVAGSQPFERVFQLLGRGVTVRWEAAEGEEAAPGTTIAVLQGPYGILLTGERTALNFLQRLSGIATAARRLVEKIKPFKTVLLDTRKTAPGWRVLEKRAVAAGGGTNHRMGLFDGILIKENHISACGGIRSAVERAKQGGGPHGSIEVEVRSLEELREALDAGPDIIMLDNMSCEEMRQAVREASGKGIPLEASGNITLDTIESVAATGVHYISCGAMTHSSCAVDVSMIAGPLF